MVEQFKKEIMKKKENYLHFRIDTVKLLHEIADCGLRENSGIFKIPLNVLRVKLGQAAQRATELNDPQMNIIMLELGLYDTDPDDIVAKIEEQKNRKK